MNSNNIDKMVEDFKGLIRINSIGGTQTVTEQYPYGKNVFEALDYMKNLALSDGFEIMEFDRHALAVVLGNANERIDVACHLDVVAQGIGWTHDPFGAENIGDMIYGRGTQDNKGPAIIAYTALKEIKRQLDHHEIPPLRRQLRVVFGCDEERTMDDMKYYIEKAGEPTFAFTPDGYFPLSIGEKGALMWTLKGKTNSSIIALDGGVQCNVIAPIAAATLQGVDPERLRDCLVRENTIHTLEIDGEEIRLSVDGKAAHASKPELGDNAILRLLKALAQAAGDPLAMMLFNTFADSYGVAAGMAIEGETMGKLTLNLGVLRISEGELYAEVDCRYPLEADSAKLTSILNNQLHGLSVSLDYDAKPVLNDESDPFIQILLKNYRAWSNDMDTAPIISGGVSYSKAIQHCVAFGPHRPNDISLAHQADECISILDMENLLRVYTRTMLDLAGGNDEH
ncbi:MAG: Sapep family Mn(2+)-dependent dipeptidase [Erysipelotrichaceae bacterium]